MAVIARVCVLFVVLFGLSSLSCGEEQADDRQKPKNGASPVNEKSGKKHVNRLAKESSPYLLQHAGNPVDWYPWGEEALARAKKEDKPIFLSIGYSTCHWCHVMERESFEDEETAKLMNELYICIKVDREERPDIDNIYMSAVQAMTGSGGWPLSVFLTPDGKPFWGGTYFPPVDGHGRPGFRTVLTSLSNAWKTKREDVLEQSDKLTAHVQSMARQSSKGEVSEKTLATAYEQLKETFDETYGGFGSAPKFPRTHILSLLLRAHDRGEAPDAAGMVTKTLEMMWQGGVYDHLGGGFHRYSTDAEWLVPHFEKMLYDQALIARSAIETWQVTGNERFAAIARDIFRYVLRDMTDAEGGFYSAEDADSEGVEGKFYVWSLFELIEVLGEEDGKLFGSVYGVTPEGNYIEEATRERTGTNILHLSKAPDAATEAKLAPMREKLFTLREKRIHPLKDDKILTDWNGLMIATLAYAGRALPDEGYTKAAEKAAEFVLSKLTHEGRLLHRYRGGKAAIDAFLDDYAFLSWGLLELYESTFDPRWLAELKRLLGEMLERFQDDEAGGFFFTGSAAEKLVSRTKEVYDGAVPSGNSVASYVLIRVGRLTMDEKLLAAGRGTIACFSGHLEQMPTGFPVLLSALDIDLGPAREIILAGTPGDKSLAALIREVHRRYLPRTVIAMSGHEDIANLIPYVKEQKPVDGKPAAYVCEDYTCKQPVTTVDELRKLLGE